MWPDGARCAAAFTFDFDAEEVWIGEDPGNAGRPGVLSQGTYGARVAVPLILELLARHGVQATFYIPGRVGERHPERVAAIVRAGHEVAHHGYTHTSPSQLSRDEEEAELVRGLEILRGFGAEVTGYRSPSWDLSPHTLDLVHQHGLSYSSNMMDDIRPYKLDRAPLVEVPISWLLDDAPHFWFDNSSWTKTVCTTAHVRALWQEEFLGIRELGGAAVFTMHPQIIGRPSRLAFLDSFLSFVTGHDDVWVTTTAQIASRA
ncbi:MAG TPA: polysaccharide deacetylase [Streptosporangiaceae bacterium]|nr:polysaccharide deacetylase [Streptosporangiaceae bacterium]